MKVSFSRAVPFIPEWNENRSKPEAEQIKTTLKPMKVEHLLVFMDAIGDRKLGEKIDAKAMGKVIMEMSNLVPEYVTLSGLEDDDGPVTVADLIAFPYYMELVSELIMKVAEISMPSEKSVKN